MSPQNELRLFGFVWLILSDVSHMTASRVAFNVLALVAFLISFLISFTEWKDKH